MASSRRNKMETMSLVHAFDDLYKISKALQTGCEAEFLAFVMNQDEARQKWLFAEQQNDSLQDKLKRVQAEAAALETQMKHARMQAEYETQRRKAAEKDKDDMENQIGVIRELLGDRNSKSVLHETDRSRLAAIANSQRQSMQNINSPDRLNTILEYSQSFLDEPSYDKTEEDILGSSKLRSGRSFKKKRPSAPPLEDDENNTPPKRHRDEKDPNSSIVTATITIDTAGKPTATVESNLPKLNKSFSEPNLDKRDGRGESEFESDDEAYGFSRNNNANINFNAKPRKSILKNTPETPGLRKANSAGRGLNRVHIFMSKTVIKPETCVPCGKRIRFSKLAMKCKECRAVCHPECREKLPLPCIPSCPSTPGNNKLAEGLISDFAPSERPMIPRLVVNCANEIESRGLNEVGIYRVPGSDKEQKELKEKFLKGRYPHLSNIADIHVICGCLKDFLRGLKEPLVTFNLWPSFVDAADTRNAGKRQEQLEGLVQALPTANRDTLAFLVQHLQTIATNPACKMPTGNLAKVFGPTVVGYSCPDPAPMQIMTETRRQNQVMERLLEMPTEFWSDLLCIDEISLFPAGTPYTPDVHSAPRSMLGPLNTPDAHESRYTSDTMRSINTPKSRLMPPLYDV